jgi:hypothetical protein
MPKKPWIDPQITKHTQCAKCKEPILDIIEMDEGLNSYHRKCLYDLELRRPLKGKRADYLPTFGMGGYFR